MWSLLPQRFQLTMIVGATALLFAAAGSVVELINLQPVTPFRLVSLAVFVLGSALVFIGNQIWRPLWKRWPVLGRVFFPDLNGTWKGELRTTWVNDQGNIPPPIQSTIWIRQTLFTLHVEQLTEESRSFSKHVFLEASPGAGRFGLWYTYANQPQAAASYRSGPHDGLARLEVRTGSWDWLTGQYFTSRKTSGDIDVKRFSSDIES